VGEALAIIGHEMRTPIQSILGFVELLSGTELDELQERWLALTRAATDHLVGLLDGMQDFACGVDALAASASAQPVAVGTVVQDATMLVEPLATARRATVRVVSNARAPLVVVANADRLRQVLLNLLSNAIKFGPSPGSVTVSLRRAGTSARIEVRDEGPGISQRDAPRVFTPFERLDAAERGIAGVGLGLALSRNLMRSMGGRLEVLDTPGRGAVFRLELPLAGPRKSE